MDVGYERNSRLLDKKYKEYFFPTMLTVLAMNGAIVVDSIIVGSLLGSDALSAVNLIIPIILIFDIFAALFGGGASTVISVAKGERKDEFANKAFTLSLVFMLAVGALIMFIPSRGVTLMITDNPILLPLVGDYLSILIYSAPVLIFMAGISFILVSDGQVKLASIAIIVANGVNLILDIVFIKIFNLGIKGSSLATLVGYLVGSLVLVVYLKSEERTLKLDYNIFKSPKEIYKNISKIVFTGMPNALRTAFVSVKIFLINMIVLSTGGARAMAVYSVCISCVAFVSMFIQGASEAMKPIVGTLYGEKDYKGIRFVIKKAFVTLGICALIVFGILQIFPEGILGLFGVIGFDEVAIGIPAIRIFSLSIIGMSVNILFLYYYTIIDKKYMANMISILQGIVIVVPVAYILANVIGIQGVWIAFVVSETLTLFIVYLYYLNLKKKSKGKIKNVLFLEDDEKIDNGILDFSIKNTIEDAVGLSEKLIDFLTNIDIDSKLSNRVGMTIEEMVVNIINYGYKKPGNYDIDIKIIVTKGEVIVSLRDDGSLFDPTKQEYNHDAEGISIVRAISEYMDYSRVLGLNNTRIVVKI